MNPIEKRRINAQEKRNKVMESAVVLFQEKGFDNVTIDDIVNAAGLSRGTFYKLFISKEDIVISSMEQWNLLYAKYYHAVLETADCTASEKIHRLMEYMLKASTKGGRDFQRTAISSSLHDPVLASKMEKSHEEITAILYKLLQQGRQEGSITSHYADGEIINFIYNLLEGATFRWAAGSIDTDIEQIIGKSLDMIDCTFKETFPREERNADG